VAIELLSSEEVFAQLTGTSPPIMLPIIRPTWGAKPQGKRSLVRRRYGSAPYDRWIAGRVEYPNCGSANTDTIQKRTGDLTALFKPADI
jgi:hypothetical protein